MAAVVKWYHRRLWKISAETFNREFDSRLRPFKIKQYGLGSKRK